MNTLAHMQQSACPALGHVSRPFKFHYRGNHDSSSERQTCTCDRLFSWNRRGHRNPSRAGGRIRYRPLRVESGACRDVVNAIRDAGGEAEAVGANLAKPEGVAALTDSLNGVFGGKFEGRLDILVNNAGTVEYGPFLESSETSYDTHFNLNVRAPIELAKDAAKRMIKTGWGRIINVGSAFGEAAPLPGVTLYIASKFAIRGFTRGLSRELGQYGVTVNAVQPGPIDTELAPTAWDGSSRNDDETRQCGSLR